MTKAPQQPFWPSNRRKHQKPQRKWDQDFASRKNSLKPPNKTQKLETKKRPWTKQRREKIWQKADDKNPWREVYNYTMNKNLGPNK